ncbi:hypothetical protein CUC44_02570 [Aeromonas lusitana]|uniref:Uncharacterized protein n=1 Tax=Aeromonas lusitana TaxID=931529 RepID=A0A2M8HE69_9GAMM|nr:hypothetical protein CUC44_02570 [Aeromonas lusitana]
MPHPLSPPLKTFFTTQGAPIYPVWDWDEGIAANQDPSLLPGMVPQETIPMAHLAKRNLVNKMGRNEIIIY